MSFFVCEMALVLVCTVFCGGFLTISHLLSVFSVIDCALCLLGGNHASAHEHLHSLFVRDSDGALATLHDTERGTQLPLVSPPFAPELAISAHAQLAALAKQSVDEHATRDAASDALAQLLEARRQAEKERNDAAQQQKTQQKDAQSSLLFTSLSLIEGITET